MKTKAKLLREQPAGSAPDCLLWELVRRNHAYLKKTKKTNLSLESHNVLSKHSPKYTGYANKPVVDVKLNSTGSLVYFRSKRLLRSRRPSSKSYEKKLPKSLKHLDYLAKAVTKDRPDLTKHVVAKYSKLVHAKTDEKQE